MHVVQQMTDAELHTLLQHMNEDELVTIGQTYSFTIEHVQQLKDYSAEFYFNDPDKALEIAQIAYQLGQVLSPLATALGAWTLGNALMFVGRYTDAKQLLQDARIVYLANNDSLNAARTSVTLVFVLAYSGQSKAALLLSKEAEPVLAAAGQYDQADLQRLGRLLLNTGVACELLGHYEDALALYERQIEIAQSLNDQVMLAQVNHNRAYAFVQMGSLHEADVSYQLAERLFIETQAQADLARLYTNYAMLLAMLKRYDEARLCQDKAARLLHMIDGMEQQQHWLTVQRCMVDIQAGWTISIEILAQISRTKAAFTEHGPPFAAGLATLILGHCYLQRQEWQQAKAAFDQAEEHAARHADRALRYRILHSHGRLAQAQNSFDAAIDAYRAAIQQIESMRGEFHVETFRADFLTDKLQIYQDLARLHIQLEELPTAFITVERAKARLLSERLTFRLSHEAATLALDEESGLQNLNQALQVTLARLETLYQQAHVEELQETESLRAAPQRKVANTIVALEQEAQQLIYQIQRQQPLFSVYATGEPAPLAQICRQLQECLLIQYHIDHDLVCAFVVGQAGIVAHVQLAELVHVEQARQGFTASVEHTLDIAARFGTQRALGYLPKLKPVADQNLQQLYQLLIKPLLPHLTVTDHLVIVPDQTLHYIPFHALFDGEKYLLERYKISYSPSATVLDLCLKQEAHGHGTLLCGYDNQHLDAVSSELKQLQAFMPDADQLIGADCTAEMVLTRAPSYNILHLATHAQFRLDQPLLSSIALANRQLTLAEIARLQLQANLVVLSGCETGHGQLRGVDLMSLAGGFLSAGAASMLVSLWRIEDKMAAQFMTNFYHHLVTGLSRADALQQAQLQLLRQDNVLGQTSAVDNEQQMYTHPAYWAPFVLIGDWRPLRLV